MENMPLPPISSGKGTSQQMGSAHNTGGVSTSAAVVTSEVPFLRLAPPSYNIILPGGESVSMQHRPNAMDSTVLALTEDVLQPEVYLYPLSFFSDFFFKLTNLLILFSLHHVRVSTTWLRDIQDWVAYVIAHI